MHVDKLQSVLSKVAFSLSCLAQNEEVLKKCAQEYLARVKQEEQRYQTLKVHAEEKLDRCVVLDFLSFDLVVKIPIECT